MKLYLTQKEKKRLSRTDRATGVRNTPALSQHIFSIFILLNRPENEYIQRNTGQLVGGYEF